MGELVTRIQTQSLPNIGQIVVDEVTKMAGDSVTRYTFLGMLCAAFITGLAIVAHGYWLNPNYTPPAVITTLVIGVLTAATTGIGVHLGTTSASSSASNSTEIAAKALQIVSDQGVPGTQNQNKN